MDEEGTELIEMKMCLNCKVNTLRANSNYDTCIPCFRKRMELKSKLMAYSLDAVIRRHTEELMKGLKD